MSDTKGRIIKEAIHAFNNAGFAAVTLFELAQSLGISRGNLTYHFKSKDDLLLAIADELWDKIKAERQKSRQLPSFENLHNEVQLYYRIQKEYAFIFLDTHVVNHPNIKEQFRQMMLESIEDNRAAIAFSVQLGNLKPEAIPGTYNNIAHITWMLSYYWLPQQKMRGLAAKEDGEKMIWSILIPHFTKKGLKSFEAFFGKKYLSELGQPFNFNLESLISF